jgi:hypothetical protein
VDHHEADHQRVDPVLGRETEGDGCNDRHSTGADRPHGGEQGGDAEHDPRDGRHLAADGAHSLLDQPVDRPVVLGDREQVRDPDQCEEQVAGEAGEDVLGGQIGHQRADEEGAGEGEHAHVDRADRGDHEHQRERQD